ncbi:putative HicB family RNase H-like nuclease [Azomonas macrocytogenes]|uniref:Putative HicB family RNase H-like nuclease n=1 Tax=Azomonas macrocytogenes TaxID=69962 RepID=A0A839T5M0_AZOMA|nr:putative HicB family RNase H-like nuclease [Azomonas macrocytogenes]
MTYKGYTARIEFDERGDIFVGRVLDLRDIISFHADSVVRQIINLVDFSTRCHDRANRRLRQL